MNYTEYMDDALIVILPEEDEIDSDKVLRFINEPETFRSFGEGLVDIIYKKYGAVDCKKLLADMAKDKQIYICR